MIEKDVCMPDTLGKRQRRAAQEKRRTTKDERRAERKAQRLGLAAGVADQRAPDQQATRAEATSRGGVPPNPAELNPNGQSLS
jgi:hypothetical protein